jgi:predicted patatin/cPLA2 family phospholipase
MVQQHIQLGTSGTLMPSDVELHGVNAERAIEAIRARAARLALGQSRFDGRKLGLVAEGGAMRGIISCGAMLGLEELGMTSVFDHVYGASAGALNAAYFLAGQAAYAVSIYHQDLNNGRFFKPIWHSKLIDIDYLFDEIIARTKRLRVERVLDSESRLHVVVGDAATARALLIDPKSASVPLLTVLKASSAMPLLYNQRVLVDGRVCFDGGLINPIPIMDAIEDGCTDVLVLMTRPASYRELPPNRFETDLFNRRCACGNEALMDAFNRCHANANNLRELALGRKEFPAVNIVTICPAEGEPTIEWTERSPHRLKAAAIASARRTLEAFGFLCEEFVEVMRPFPYFSPCLQPLTGDRKIPA